MPRGFLGRKGETGAPSGDKQKGEEKGGGEKTRRQKKTFCRDNVGEFLPPSLSFGVGEKQQKPDLGRAGEIERQEERSRRGERIDFLCQGCV